jgi:hypothetical protein
MIHRDEIRARIEVLDWITTVGHDLFDQTVRVPRGPHRIVDEADLDPFPLVDVAPCRVRRERPNVQLVATLPSIVQFGLRLSSRGRI